MREKVGILRECIGFLVLLVICGFSIYTLFSADLVTERIAFAGISIICAAILTFDNRLAALTFKALGIELKATLEQVRTDAKEIEAIRDSMQKQLNEVKQLARNARKLIEMGH